MRKVGIPSSGVQRVKSLPTAQFSTELFGLVLAAEPSLEQGDDSTHRRLFSSIPQNLYGCSNQARSQLKQFIRIDPLEVLHTVFKSLQKSLQAGISVVVTEFHSH